MAKVTDTRLLSVTLPALSLAALLTASCNKPEATRPKEPAVAVEYADLPNHLGKRVVVTGWLLGHGEAFRTPGPPDDYYFLLVPDPEVDWKAFFEDYDALERLIEEIKDGDSARRAEAKHVVEFSNLQTALQTWRGLVLGQEARDDVTTWARFHQNVIEAEFAAIPEGPIVLVTPTRGELLESATRLLNDFKAIEHSAEVEATGTLVRTGDPPSGERSEPLPAALSKKPFLLHVESFKILRTARDMLAEEPAVAGSAPLAEPETAPPGGGR
jgi:hypothetical protein